MPPIKAAVTASITDRLADIVGFENVLCGDDQRTFYATDLALSGVPAKAVVKVGDAAQLARCVALCVLEGLVVIPRGGGFSYTGGYTPVQADTVIFDLRGLDDVIEINEANMYVRVGAGCTWHNLYNTLKARGLRTPYYGPMSGYSATIGGALSQGSFFLGSTEYGTVMDSVLSVEVVLADGEIIHTGSDGGVGVQPFYRNYGPDLTGLFLADTGALGFKTAATLKLIQFPPAQAFGTFAFADGEEAMAALSDIARAGLAAEAYVWDPFFVKMMSESTGMSEDLKFLVGVMREGSGIIDSLKAGFQTALAGKKVFKQGTHLMQLTIDDRSQVGADARLRQVREIVQKYSGGELAPSIPRALRAMPFTNFNVAERRTALRNLPTNGLYSHTKAPEALKGLLAVIAAEASTMREHAIEVGTIFFAVGKNAICIEPLLYWEDPEFLRHDRIDERSSETTEPVSARTEFAHEMRTKLKAVMEANAAVHVQIGKAYEFLPSREPRVAKLLRQIKAAVDPGGNVNPGSLGL